MFKNLNQLIKRFLEYWFLNHVLIVNNKKNINNKNKINNKNTSNNKREKKSKKNNNKLLMIHKNVFILYLNFARPRQLDVIFCFFSGFEIYSEKKFFGVF